MINEPSPEFLARALRIDHEEVSRAREDLTLLSPETIEDRVFEAQQEFDNLMICPVCHQRAFRPQGHDVKGLGIFAGTCHVCFYDRTPTMAYKISMDILEGRILDSDAYEKDD